MKKVLAFLMFAIVSCSLAQTAFADNSIFINEFQIEPDPQQVEIINTASTSADLSHWYIDDSGGTTYFTIPDGTTLFPNSCLVFTGDFNLNKSSTDAIRLFDNTTPPTDPNAKMIDSFSYRSSSGSAVTFQRVPDGQSWIIEQPSLGKFNITHENCIVTPSSTPTPLPTNTPIPTPQPENQPSQTSYDHIYVSEVMAYPNAGENEWVEFYNDNDFAVELNKWYIDDVQDGGSTPKQFSITIAAKGYSTYDFSTGMFNNDTDSIRLLDFNKSFKDGFDYNGPQRGLTINRKEWNSDAYCISDSSKSAPNHDCINTDTPSSTPVPSRTPTPKSTNKTQSTLTNSKSYLINNNTQLPDFTTANQVELDEGSDSGEVRAATVQNTQPDNNDDAFQESSSMASFGLALLSAVSTVLKLRAKIGA